MVKYRFSLLCLWENERIIWFSGHTESHLTCFSKHWLYQDYKCIQSCKGISEHTQTDTFHTWPSHLFGGSSCSEFPGLNSEDGTLFGLTKPPLVMCLPLVERSTASQAGRQCDDSFPQLWALRWNPITMWETTRNTGRAGRAAATGKLPRAEHRPHHCCCSS